ncbi:MAG: diguanylate cyclase domain-containing protein [Aliihoeflea sp.]
MDRIDGRANPRKLQRDIYVAAGLTVFAFALALSFIVDRASVTANRIALESDFRLLKAELESQRRQAAYVMNEATTSLDGLVTLARRQPSLVFMIEDMKHWIANDYGLRQVLVVDGNDTFRFAMRDGIETDDPQALPLAGVAVHAAARARDYFHETLPSLPEGWEFDNARSNSRERYVFSDFGTLDGQFGMVLAQFIVPWADDGIFMEGDGHVHVAFRALDRGGLDTAVRRLNLSGFRVSGIEDAPALEARLDVRSHLKDAAAFSLLWDQPDPRSEILRSVWLSALLLVTTIMALLAVMLRRYRVALAELAASEEKNHRLANQDPLTGLANRVRFDAFLDRKIKLAPAEGFAVMCIDLDRFKAVNDTYGHNAGDAVLVATARRFADRVGNKGLVARVGGDEFVVLVCQGIEPRTLLELGNRLISDAVAPVRFEGNDLKIGASIGVSIWPSNGITAKEIINAADQVLYASKRAGRGRCTISETNASAPLAAVA